MISKVKLTSDCFWIAGYVYCPGLIKNYLSVLEFDKRSFFQRIYYKQPMGGSWVDELSRSLPGVQEEKIYHWISESSLLCAEYLG